MDLQELNEAMDAFVANNTRLMGTAAQPSSPDPNFYVGIVGTGYDSDTSTTSDMAVVFPVQPQLLSDDGSDQVTLPEYLVGLVTADGRLATCREYSVTADLDATADL